VSERSDDPIYQVARMERAQGSGPIWLFPVAMLAVGTTVGPVWFSLQAAWAL